MDLYIKNMVCPRCVAAVEELLQEHSIPYTSVDLGHAVLQRALTDEETTTLDHRLKHLGFERLDDKRMKLVEQVRNVVILSVHHHPDSIYKRNLSDLISEEIGQDYKYISTIFREVTGNTIEKFYIRHKIERAKELIAYGELTLKEIAYQMGYSSEAYLSNQFKKVTGITPSEFKKAGEHERVPLDQLL